MNRIIRHVLLFTTMFTLPLAAFSLFNIGGFGMSPFKLMTALLLVFTAFDLVLGRRKHVRNESLFWVLAFALALGVSIVQGFLQGVPPEKLVPEITTYYSIVLFYVLIGFMVTDLPALRAALWGLVLGGVATAIPPVLSLERASEAGRFTGLSGQENTLGRDMVAIAPVALALMFTARSQIVRLLMMGAAVTTVGGLLLSLSRTAFVSGAAMWALWISRSGRIDSVRYLIPAVAVMAGVVLMAPDSVTERISTVTERSARTADGSIQARLDQFEFAARAFTSNPITGVGMLNFTLWARKQPGGQKIVHVVHNAYLSVLAEQGLLGFVPYVTILFLAWRQYGQAYRGARARRQTKDPVLLQLTTFALLLQISLFGNLVASLAGIMQKSKAMWLVIALAPAVRGMVMARLAELQDTGSSTPVAPITPEDLNSSPGAHWAPTR